MTGANLSARFRELPTDRRGERLWVHRTELLPGIDFMKVADSDRNWVVVHDTYSACLVLSPENLSAEWRYRGRTHSIESGEMQLMEPGEVHRTTKVSGPASFFVLRWQPKALQEAAEQLGTPRALHFRAAQASHPALVAAFRSLHDNLCAPSAYEDVECWLAESTYLLVEHCAEGSAQRSALAVAHCGLRRARRYLDEHFASDIALEKLAKQAGMAKYHFAHSFTRTYGVPPRRYLTLRRVEAARRHIENGTSIVEASALVGFADQAHLTRKFKDVMGVTPGVWADAMRRRKTFSLPAKPVANATLSSRSRR